MNTAQLEAFRQTARDMGVTEQGWQWIGLHTSQRHFGISEERAKAFAARHGGEAKAIEVVS